MHHADKTSAVINGEEDPVHVRPVPVAQYPDWVIRIDAFRRDRPAPRVLIEGENSPFETVEPFGALLRRSRHDPEVQLFELGFGVPRDLNAVCHASDAGGQTPDAPASSGRP